MTRKLIGALILLMFLLGATLARAGTVPPARPEPARLSWAAADRAPAGR